ncbi:hypothetical protein KI387_006602, partial [Taxus chinensis]
MWVQRLSYADVSPSQLVIANYGDSRAVLSRGGKAIPLSNDHKPEREDEMGCIEAAGGRVPHMLFLPNWLWGRRSGDKSSSPLSEASGKTEESNEEPFSRTSDQESESPIESHEQASPITVENLASGINVRDSILQNVVSQTEPSKQNPVVQLDSQYSIVKTAPSYASVGFVPQLISSHYPSYEPALTSPHDASCQPSIVMQQMYDPSSSIYNPFLRLGSDGDARFPPFVGPTA